MAKSKIRKNLTKKEMAFCRHYVETGNAKEAAKIAGLSEKELQETLKTLLAMQEEERI